ncbi:hypothetical protein N7471_001928 [Penicillium samsonianum]|uniref:uncharacterized protein n=1 Tax=Penicillium samsonianum TaxID=1882272 RepID=UPI002546713C|nr:uncharacterized protein N7471_001928 [Penicillium samsonianum]KAJ6142475.1 hypothetical protein N7471_001928 [Penicillium samsonianum]
MRFISGLLGTYAAIVSALPQAVPEAFSWEETCSGIETKSQENWKKGGFGEWFSVTASVEGIYTQDIQKTIQSWESDDQSSLYGFYCSPMSHCEANLDKDQCLDPEHPIRPALYFVMWSIANLNNWMDSLLTAVDHTAGIADARAADLVNTFATNMENIPLLNAGPALAAGFLGSLAAIFPPAAVAGGFASGLATIGAGLLSLTSNSKPVELEPKFNDFTDITTYIAKASEGMQKSIETYTQWLLTSIPSNDRANGINYIYDPKSLPNVLLDGDFAEPRISDVLPDGIYVSLFSAAVALLWKEESARVVKISHELPTLSKLVCDHEKVMYGNKWCDSEGNAYILLGWDKTWFKTPWDQAAAESLQDLKGIGKLQEYRLSIEIVSTASEYASLLNGGRSYYEWNTARVIEHMNQDEKNMAKFSGFNLPFCEIAPSAYGVGGNELLDRAECDEQCQVIWAMRDCFQGEDPEHPGVGLFFIDDFGYHYPITPCIPGHQC